MRTYRTIPRGIWALGFVSLFMDTSSELVHSLLPVFMVTALGASMTSVGIVEGIAESTALIVKVFSGVISDRLGKRKMLTVIGYGLAAITKPLFPLASSIGLVISARFIDRIGKGIRGAPRDALLSDLAPPEIRGASFGLRQALDTVGAFLGPLLAILGMWLLASDVRAVLWIAVVPAVLSVVILVFGVQEPVVKHEGTRRSMMSLRDLRDVGRGYWNVVIAGGILTLARFSEAFLLLKAHDTGVAMMFVPLVMVAMNLVYSLAAYPAGAVSDRISRRTVLLMGIGFLVLADIVLGLSTNLATLIIGVALWGLHMAFTQGLLAAQVADTTPSSLRGSAYGVFNLVSGIAMLVASVVAGILWDSFGSQSTFLYGGIAAGCAFLWIYKMRAPS
ncbi:MAG: MFS transporter [Candidatus Kapabacteria bacterium]|nr:MFS transporter [Candidatus Kapabacteria bacterium]